ncbi:DIP1984 family protein [Fusobacterium hominis]|uniref:Uncharacterized protein n=1 Tax=Fusobacterium hominis TaxID=2764326 RepID=A0A7G9GZP0_9FUSO|nr:hypothetical protein [Fusobacterium hominis]QNM16272.1 hypothetical protein H9Q81_07195 [Fusobacterium hominis]
MANKSNYFPRRSSHFKNYKVILTGRGSRTIDVGKKQKEIDKLSKKLRELDTKIQGLNWTTELK